LEELQMTVKQIREKAKEMQIKNIAKLRKEELICAIQLAEGNNDCYKKLSPCGESECCWREDCQN